MSASTTVRTATVSSTADDSGINLKWCADEIDGRKYPALPFPPEFRSLSGEAGQALLTGTATKTEVFRGGTEDDELEAAAAFSVASESWRLHF